MAEVNPMINFGQTKMPFPNYEHNPTNFFWRFSPKNSSDKAQLSVLSSSESEDEEEEPELNLCLSLGGIYAKPTKEKQNPLARSSSIAGEESETHRRGLETLPFLSLSRSCSLPTETNNHNNKSREEEMVKLRDLASMRRMAAKKRLAEKQRGFRDVLEEEVSLVPVSEVAAWAAASAAKSAALSRAICKIKGQECSTVARDNSTSLKNGAEPPAMFLATISNRSQFVKPAAEETNKPQQNPLKKVKASSGEVLNNWMDVMNRMPCVTTTGDGPNGKRIDGFLYKYTKGQVSIVCVCHGSFLSPAEFIKHAGGKEVANPMRHINVCAALPL